MACLAVGAIRHLGRAVPRPLGLGALFHDAMPRTHRGLAGLHCAVVCWGLHPEPLACLLDLRLDAGEVHTTQGHQDFMAVQGGFQGDGPGCLWQCWCFRLGVHLALFGWCLGAHSWPGQAALAVAWRVPVHAAQYHH